MAQSRHGPLKEFPETLTVRVTSPVRGAIRTFAKQWDCSEGEAIRQLLQIGIAAFEPRPPKRKT